MTPQQTYQLNMSGANTTGSKKLGSQLASKNTGSALFNNSNLARMPNLVRPDQALIQKMLREESDDRYRYLVRNGTIHFVESDTLTIYVELSQIPNVFIVYRRPSERLQNAEKLNLECRGLRHVPLLEGEEKLK